MAIVPLARLTLVGELKHRDTVIAKLQHLGCIHVADLSDVDGNQSHTSFGQDELKSAITYLERCPEKRPPAPPLQTHKDVHREHEEMRKITTEILQVESESRSLAEEQESVIEKREQTRPWGNFNFPSPSELGGQQMYFYRLTPRQARTVPPEVRTKFSFSLIDADRQHEYWALVGSQSPDAMPCEPEDLDTRCLDALECRLDEICQQRERLQVRRIALTRWLDRLRSQSVVIENKTTRLIATQRSWIDGPIFVLRGWVPERKLDELAAFAKQNTLVYQSQRPRFDDQPPTLLSNPRPIAGAEGAVTFFMTPGYRDWDPTWVMFFSFAAFFAMILADAGYGLVLGLILGFFAKRLGRTESGRRFRQLAVFMVAVTIIYGIVIGSFFGFSPSSGSWFDRLVIKSHGQSIMQDREAMMLVSATIGVFHLVLANAIVAWRWMGSGRAIASLGWASGLIGGWMLALTMIPKPNVMILATRWFGGNEQAWTQWVATTGWWTLGIGLSLVFLFSSNRPVLSSRPTDWLMRVVDGLMGLTGATKAFGDALSYLRLFALGLASAQLAIIFNQLASDASQMKGVGILLGLLIFLTGHSLNLVLAVVGGVVHGLRLNCIEFFSWSLTEEGQPFQAFEMKADK